MQAVRRAAEDPAAGRHPGVEHLDDLDHAHGPGGGPSGELRRHALLQPGRPDAAGRGDPRREDQRRDRGRRWSPWPSASARRRSWSAIAPASWSTASCSRTSTSRWCCWRKGRRRAHRQGGDGLRHADGPDHAQRPGRPGHVAVRRPRGQHGFRRPGQGDAHPGRTGGRRPAGPEDRAPASTATPRAAAAPTIRPSRRILDKCRTGDARRSAWRRSPIGCSCRC